MADGMNVFHGAVRKENSELDIVFGSFTEGSLDGSLPSVAILGMNAFEPFFPTRRAFFWIEIVDAIPFVGEMQCLSSDCAQDPASRMREPLGFLKVRLAALQGLIEKAQSPCGVVENLPELGNFVLTRKGNSMPKLAAGQGLRALDEQAKRPGDTASNGKT